MRKLLVSAALSAALLVGATGAFAADTTTDKTPVTSGSVAVVNLQEIFQQSSHIADLNKKLQDQFKERQEKLVAAQKALQAGSDKYQKESGKMSEKDKTKLQDKISSDQASLSKDADAFQKDLAAEQKKVMGGVLADLNNIITKMAKADHYSMVLDSQAVIYSADSTDITKDVAAQFDKSGK